MGVYYFYINDAKKQYFCIDPTLLDIKGYALGQNIGSRALSYLILNNDPHYTGIDAHPLIGSWIGDRFFVTGDEYYSQFDLLKEEYTDIGQAIIEMLVQVQPFDLFQYGGSDWLVSFIQHDGQPITITNDMRKRISHTFRHAYHLHPNDDVKKVIDALKNST